MVIKTDVKSTWSLNPLTFFRTIDLTMLETNLDEETDTDKQIKRVNNYLNMKNIKEFLKNANINFEKTEQNELNVSNDIFLPSNISVTLNSSCYSMKDPDFIELNAILEDKTVILNMLRHIEYFRDIEFKFN